MAAGDKTRTMTASDRKIAVPNSKFPVSDKKPIAPHNDDVMEVDEASWVFSRTKRTQTSGDSVEGRLMVEVSEDRKKGKSRGTYGEGDSIAPGVGRVPIKGDFLPRARRSSHIDEWKRATNGRDVHISALTHDVRGVRDTIDERAQVITDLKIETGSMAEKSETPNAAASVDTILTLEDVSIMGCSDGDVRMLHRLSKSMATTARNHLSHILQRKPKWRDRSKSKTCMLRRAMIATCDWTTREEQGMFSCKYCTLRGKPCMRYVDGKVIILPLPPLLVSSGCKLGSTKHHVYNNPLISEKDLRGSGIWTK